MIADISSSAPLIEDQRWSTRSLPPDVLAGIGMCMEAPKRRNIRSALSQCAFRIVVVTFPFWYQRSIDRPHLAGWCILPSEIAVKSAQNSRYCPVASAHLTKSQRHTGASFAICDLVGNGKVWSTPSTRLEASEVALSYEWIR